MTYSCSSNGINEELSQSLSNPHYNYKTPQETLADSMVSLCFKDFTLGQPLSSALKKAQNCNHIWQFYHSGNTFKGISNILLLDSDIPLRVELCITTYHDTIYKIELESDSERAFGNLEDLYVKKYGNGYTSNFYKRVNGYLTSIHSYHKWIYSNQEVGVYENDYRKSVSTNISKTRQKQILRDYGHGVRVVYKDYLYLEKAIIADSIKRENEKVIEEHKKHIQDSIKKVRNDKRAQKAIKQI